MENQSYWRTFEQTGAVTDYLHYLACVRDELAVGITEGISYRENDGEREEAGGDESVLMASERAAMRGVIAASAMAVGVPASPEFAGISGTPAVLGTSAAIGAALMSDLDDTAAKDRRKRDPNP